MFEVALIFGAFNLFLFGCCFDFPSRVQNCKRLWVYVVSAAGRCAVAIRLRLQYRTPTKTPSRRDSTANTLLVDETDSAIESPMDFNVPITNKYDP
ncbi:hypothetical protein SDRG_16006 [Saprolegnia diclina VS20]|uniref:Secreted protein n=1 Tax=Saprolegnia diclina (strain VS20) TaxID=1156394 RepID=T0PL91_SAPDV|nr:hypothetical protein SDRG_16006 [Saprolegnia diclina VS20]EQC26154.1 hypothetical protein SDRG_16006 [Saprolegnia diclina VS20]|eukprot:XP_008620417.1 hypothetical protein SDRG_16006 [Saprolegnia diclina VS20]